MSGESLTKLEARDGLLAEARLVSLTVYVRDVARAQEFYGSRLGLRAVAAGENGEATYDVGPATLCLRNADADGIALPEEHDDASDIVFLVEDVQTTKAALEHRGIRFERQRTYGIGSVIDFYDPDGHRLMLYEPSAHALTTPAQGTIRSVWRAYGRGGNGLIGPSSGPGGDPMDQGLDGKPLIYLFAFVKDIGDAKSFYEDALGLTVMERSHCCNDDCPDHEKGVVKYEGGGVILSTHHLHGHHAVHDDYGTPYGARDYAVGLAQGVAPVFAVPEIARALETLSRNEIEPASLSRRSPVGATAGVISPSGHLLYLREVATPATASTGSANGSREASSTQ